EWLAKMVGGMDKDAVSGFTAVVNTLARSGILVAGAFASAGSAMGAFMAASHELLSNNGKFIQDGKMFTPDELVKYTQARLDGKSTEGIGSPVDAAGAQVAKADAILSEFWADQKKHWAGILDDVATFGDETAKAMEKAMPKGDNRPDLPFTPTAPGTKGKGAKPHDLTQGLRDQLLQLSLTDKQFQLYRLAVQGAGADQIDLAGGMIDTIAQLKAQQDATAELARVLEDAKTPAQQFGDAMQRIADARDVALATQSGAQLQFTLSQLDELAKRTNAVFLESQAGMDAMTEFARQAAHNIQDAFAQFLFDPFHDGVKGMLRSFAEMLQKMAAQAAASQLLQSLGNSMSGSSTGWVAALGHALAGARAAGGPVSGGGTYLVGEKGPELFTPSSSGHITPNDQIASVTRSGGITVQSSVTVNAGGRDSGDPTQDAVMARQLNEMVKRSAKDVILRALQPGGIIWNQQHRVSA
ncbi:MAG TPA: hypothetical protein VJ823_00185, partial [Rhodanobacteraceae bacterium]|nr:hypothetical protein [Rhodanobacteraceae bacterium]